MSVRKPRKRRITDFSNPDFEPESRSSWKRNKRADLRTGSTRHHAMKAAKRAEKRRLRAEAAKAAEAAATESE